MSAGSARILLEKHKAAKIGFLVVNRPDKHNAMDQQVMEEWLAALEKLRTDDDVRVVVTRGNGRSFGSGLDLHYLRSIAAQGAVPDWERSSLPRTLSDTIRNFPKVTIAQVHGYCLGHSMVNMFSHDLAFAAATARIGMPEIRRGSFGQMATANLFHSGVPAKKAAFMQLTGTDVSGTEADRLGMVSTSVPDDELEAFALKTATQIATYHPAALAAAKIAVQMGSKLGVADAMRLDQLVGAWQRESIDSPAQIDKFVKARTRRKRS